VFSKASKNLSQLQGFKGHASPLTIFNCAGISAQGKHDVTNMLGVHHACFQQQLFGECAEWSASNGNARKHAHITDSRDF
jgi:hypothetical protein